MNYLLYICAKLYIGIYLNINYDLLLLELLLIVVIKYKKKMQDLKNIYDDIKQNIKLNQNLDLKCSVLVLIAQLILSVSYVYSNLLASNG